MKLFVFGSQTVESDRLAFKVADALLSMLKDIEVIKCTNPEDMFSLSRKELEGNDAVILDVARGIKDVQPLMIDDLQPQGIYTVHDFNLGLYLKLLKTTNQLKEMRIIGIPYDSREAPQKIAKKVRKILGI